MKTTTKELSKKLAAALSAAGYEYENEYAYIENELTDNPITELECEYMEVMHQTVSVFSESLPAFTMFELWDMLPKTIVTVNGVYRRAFIETDNDFTCTYCKMLKSGLMDFYASSHARAEITVIVKLILWCIENGHNLNLKKEEE